MVKKLLFVSPRFLFPSDSGGKIRTSQILRGMKGGAFEITLISPAPDDVSKYQGELDSVCDNFQCWKENKHKFLFQLTRMRHIFSAIPIPIITDASVAGKHLVKIELSKKPDVVVFDFLHSTIHSPDNIPVPSVLFTHNVEAEIFLRHTQVATNPLVRKLWNNQYQKMLTFEENALIKFDLNIAVSTKDADYFRNQFNLSNIREIPTGTDLDFYRYQTPSDNKNLVFTGSMDWNANIDGIKYFLESILPLISRNEPNINLQIVGRNPPTQMVKKYHKQKFNIEFTGFVDDVRSYVWNAAIYIIPLRVGSGTRIKAFEAMAMGCPIVSTTLGVEGLDMEPGKHYLCADTPEAFSKAVCELLSDKTLRETISRNARQHVEQNFSSQWVSDKFEAICLEAIDINA